LDHFRNRKNKITFANENEEYLHMSTKLITLNLEKDEFLEESKRLQILLSARVIDHDQIVEDLRRCEATLHIFEDVTKKNFERLKILVLQVKKILQVVSNSTDFDASALASDVCANNNFLIRQAIT